jgi:hypothetical protein
MSKDPENNNLNNESNSFGLPEGYFQKSANSIFNKIEWLEEHKEFTRLSELKNSVNPNGGFIVPADYFNSSDSDLELIAYPDLLKQKRSDNFESGYIVPGDYFEDLEVNELAKILKDKKSELEPFQILNSIKKQNCFTTDPDYFADSEQKIISALSKEAKVIGLFRPKIWFSAAAAVFAIVLSLWVYNQYFKAEVVKDCGTLACVDKADIIKAKMETLDEDELYQTIDTKKLQEKLEGKPLKEKNNTDTGSKKISTEDLLDEI